MALGGITTEQPFKTQIRFTQKRHPVVTLESTKVERIASIWVYIYSEQSYVVMLVICAVDHFCCDFGLDTAKVVWSKDPRRIVNWCSYYSIKQRFFVLIVGSYCPEEH
jgi:hypothetical protein